MTMLPVLYQYSGFGARAPRADQQRFINTPESLLELLGALRRARPESAALRYGVAPHSLRAVSEESLRALARRTRYGVARCAGAYPYRRTDRRSRCVPRDRRRAAGAMAARSFRCRRALVPRACDARRCERNAARWRRAARWRGFVPDDRSQSRRRHFSGARRISTRRGASASARIAISASTGAPNCVCSNTASVCRGGSATCWHRRRGRACGRPSCSTPRSTAARRPPAAPSARCRPGSRADWLVLDADHPSIAEHAPRRVAFRRRVLRAWRDADSRRLHRRRKVVDRPQASRRRASVCGVPRGAGRIAQVSV